MQDLGLNTDGIPVSIRHHGIRDLMTAMSKAPRFAWRVPSELLPDAEAVVDMRFIPSHALLRSCSSAGVEPAGVQPASLVRCSGPSISVEVKPKANIPIRRQGGADSRIAFFTA